MNVRYTCRVCEGSLEPILDLGELCVSNFLSPEEPDGAKAPLDLVLCRRCRLLQLRHTVPAEIMYRNYWYRSGTNQTMRTALADIADKAETLAHLEKGDAVLDIGCNDGTLLASYKTGGLRRIGFDPATNLAGFSRKAADTVVVDCFTSEAWSGEAALAGVRPKVVTSIAMFYDLEEPNRFVADVKRVLRPDGLWVVQMSYLPMMLRMNELGNVCHEHLEYYSLQSFEYLLQLHDLEVVDLELNDVNGGSIRTYIRNRGIDPTAFADATYRKLAMERVQALREEEIRLGLDGIEVYREFAGWVDRIKQDVAGFIRDQVARGKKIYVYGASTKGNTLLQYFGQTTSSSRRRRSATPTSGGRSRWGPGSRSSPRRRRAPRGPTSSSSSPGTSSRSSWSVRRTTCSRGVASSSRCRTSP